MKILVTGAAGFIGSRLAEVLLQKGYTVIGIDNINNYYDPNLKIARLQRTGIEVPENSQKVKTLPCSGPDLHEVEYPEIPYGMEISSSLYPNFKFIRLDITDDRAIDELFEREQFDSVVHLAAQAGVRYSLINPRAYIKSNVDGFLNILEASKNNKIKHLVYASSSSIYGLNAKVPFSEHDSAEHPVSLYAATKKSNEMMAHTYSHLYGLPTTGLRFFTVYGPWGRPDMSPYLFIHAILKNQPVKVFNNGDMLRDFTYIDDIVEGITRIIDKIPRKNENWDAEKPDPSSSSAPYKIYNIGNQKPIKLLDYVECIEKAVGKKAEKNFYPMQPGDVHQTFSDSGELEKITGFIPQTSLPKGIKETVNWYTKYFKI